MSETTACPYHGAQPIRWIHPRLGMGICEVCARRMDHQRRVIWELDSEPGGGARRLMLLFDGWSKRSPR